MRLNIPKPIEKALVELDAMSSTQVFTSLILVAVMIAFVLQTMRVSRMEEMATYLAGPYGESYRSLNCSSQLILAAATDGSFPFRPDEFARGVASSVCPRPAYPPLIEKLP